MNEDGTGGGKGKEDGGRMEEGGMRRRRKRREELMRRVKGGRRGWALSDEGVPSVKGRRGRFAVRVAAERRMIKDDALIWYFPQLEKRRRMASIQKCDIRRCG